MEQPTSPPPKYDFDRDIELLRQWEANPAARQAARTARKELYVSVFTSVVLVCAIVATAMVTVLR